MRAELIPKLSPDDLIKVYVNCLEHAEHPKFGLEAARLKPLLLAEFLKRERESGAEFLPMLRCMGYHTRYYGFTEVARLRALRTIIESELPHINSPEYMQSWGAPRTAKRVGEVYSTIQTYIQRYGGRLGLDAAVERWQSDLIWLRNIIDDYR